MKTQFVAALLIFCLGLAAAQSAPKSQQASHPAPRPAIVVPIVAASPPPPPPQSGASAPWTALSARMEALEKAVQDAGEKAKIAADRAPWFALGTVLLSGAIALIAQFVLMWHQRRQSADQAREQISNSYAEWQLKQLCELYGPLRALLGQSNALYRQMNDLLIKNEPARFRFVKQAGDDFDDKVFEMKVDGKWTRFRTVKHLDQVYGAGLGVEPLFDAVAEVADRIATLIRERAGYARLEDEGLIEVLGQYLAHYVTLKEVHRRVKESEEGGQRYVNDAATFPIKIQGMVDKGFRELNGDLAGWRSKGMSAPKSR